VRFIFAVGVAVGVLRGALRCVLQWCCSAILFPGVCCSGCVAVCVAVELPCYSFSRCVLQCDLFLQWVLQWGVAGCGAVCVAVVLQSDLISRCVLQWVCFRVCCRVCCGGVAAQV